MIKYWPKKFDQRSKLCKNICEHTTCYYGWENKNPDLIYKQETVPNSIKNRSQFGFQRKKAFQRKNCSQFAFQQKKKRFSTQKKPGPID